MDGNEAYEKELYIVDLSVEAKESERPTNYLGKLSEISKIHQEASVMKVVQQWQRTNSNPWDRIMNSDQEAKVTQGTNGSGTTDIHTQNAKFIQSHYIPNKINSKSQLYI